jgi:DNA-binding transcriptional ArsR family regulator
MSNRNLPLPLTPEQTQSVAALFKVLGEPMRLRILQCVCHESRSVNEIVELTGSTQANISKHLSLLRAAGVLSREKRGQQVFYSLRDPMALDLCKTVRARLTGSR